MPGADMVQRLCFPVIAWKDWVAVHGDGFEAAGLLTVRVGI